MGGAREVADRRAGVGPLATLMAVFAVVALFLTVGSLLVIGGVVFALFLFSPCSLALWSASLPGSRTTR
jgi:hypothetical protein